MEYIKKFFKTHKFTKISAIVAMLYITGTLILEPTLFPILFGIIGGMTLVASASYIDQTISKKVEKNFKNKNITNSNYLEDTQSDLYVNKKVKDNEIPKIDIRKLGLETNDFFIKEQPKVRKLKR